MTIDLVCVNHNTFPLLLRFLGMLHRDDDLGWKLYIADNGSTDGSAEFLERSRDEYRIERVAFNDNIGYARAVNVLASVGESDIIGVLNADVWLSSAHVRAIEKAFSDPDIAILGPKQMNESCQIVHGGIIGVNTRPTHQGWKVSDPEDKLFRELQEVISVSGSAYFIRRTVWDELAECDVFREAHPTAAGAFLPTQHYYEETWCSYHARAHGYKVFYDGRVSIGHSWHASSPVGGAADHQFVVSQATFRDMCDRHGIPRD